jgi:hypothetical protein
MAALAAVRHTPELKRFYDRLRAAAYRGTLSGLPAARKRYL